MTAFILTVAGLGCLLLASLTLRSLGSSYRVGRLLSAAPQVSIDEAIALANIGASRFVRVHGRIASDEEFPDEQDRPLVFRRTRVELADGRGGWRRVLDDREAVAFGIESRSSFIGVDETALDDGLVVIPRETTGFARDLPADLAGEPTAVDGGSVAARPDPSTPTRLVIEQVSAVEHAVVAGQPLLRDGKPVLTTGLGRPLILTTLELPAAMRVLARTGRGRVVLSAILLVVGLGLAAAATVAALIGA